VTPHRAYMWKQVSLWARTTAEELRSGWGWKRKKGVHKDDHLESLIREHAQVLGSFNPVSHELTEMDRNPRRVYSAWKRYVELSTKYYKEASR
jgi:hypothetical protein